MVVIEVAVRKAREAVAMRGLGLGEIFWARFIEQEDKCCISFSVKNQITFMFYETG
jgi:hypothetical protein